MLLLPLALAGPNTLIVGVESDTSMLSPWKPRCFDAARVCWFEAEDSSTYARVAMLPGIRYIEHDARIPVPPPADGQGTAECPDLWELDLFGPLPVEGHNAPVVAIQDGGFRLSHEEIRNRISGQWDYGDGDPIADLSWSVAIPAHGSFIAGMIAGDPDNGVGRAGLAPYALLNLQKIADQSGALYWSYAIAAMEDLADGDLGVRILNYSIGGSSYNQGFYDAVSALSTVDILVVAAAGNCDVENCADADNDLHDFYPANFEMDHLISVAGSTREDDLNPWSHYGASTVDLAAPGVDLCSLGAYSDDDYYSASGTSYATPLVAAAAALLLEAHPDLSPLEMGRVLRASVHQTPALSGKVLSGGRLDPGAALATAVPRLTQAPDLALEKRGSWELQLENAGEETEDAYLLLFHPDGLRLDHPQAAAFEIGAILELPDAGSWTATAPGTLVHFSLATHEVATLPLTWVGLEEGAFGVQYRMVTSSLPEGAPYLNAPYREGELDPSGFLSYTATITVSAAIGDSGGEDSPPPDSPPVDSSVEESSPPPDTGKEEPTNCGCSSSGGSLTPLLLLGLYRRRRPWVRGHSARLPQAPLA